MPDFVCTSKELARAIGVTHTAVLRQMNLYKKNGRISNKDYKVFIELAKSGARPKTIKFTKAALVDYLLYSRLHRAKRLIKWVFIGKTVQEWVTEKKYLH